MPRMMHAKTICGVANASLVIDHVLPAALAIDHFQPGARLPAIVRFSNGSGLLQADGAPDLRGMAIRIALPGGGHDLLFTNFPTSLARNAQQFYVFVLASFGQRETLLARLVGQVGAQETHRIAAHLKASLRLCPSLAGECFWSGSPHLWGDRPARLELHPMAAAEKAGSAPPLASDALRLDLASRLASGDIRYRLAIQRHVNDRCTPIEDASVDWPHDVSPPVGIATLTIPAQDILAPEGEAQRRLVEGLAFNPWNAPAPFRPLGSLNRMRRLVYEMAAHRRLEGARRP